MRPRLLIPPVSTVCVCTDVREISLYHLVSQCCQSCYSSGGGNRVDIWHRMLWTLSSPYTTLLAELLTGPRNTHSHTERRSGASDSICCRSLGTQHQLRLACRAGWPIKPSRNRREMCRDKTEQAIINSYTESNGTVENNVPIRYSAVMSLCSVCFVELRRIRTLDFAAL